MLEKSELMDIALKECISMLGEELVKSNKDFCCCTCGFNWEGLFIYNLGVDTNQRMDKMKEFVLLGDETPPEFYASVIVDPDSGKVIRDYENSKLPKQP